MPRFRGLTAGGLFLLLAGCQPKVEVAAATRELLRTDRAWATLAAANGPWTVSWPIGRPTPA
jgi:hypothetical protein